MSSVLAEMFFEAAPAIAFIVGMFIVTYLDLKRN
ncbi:hypothetical protein SRABI82_04741 [Priestia megaterium]|nr:hypothetical protein SRABI82_04741 [Priestia megaterium]